MQCYELIERWTNGPGAYITKNLTLERAEELRAEGIQRHVDYDVQHSPHYVDEAELERLTALAESFFEIVPGRDFAA
tara:strand:- start:1248 stop:1478 length:231 start_codon:yes stop_codon:yes gene_type:complete